MFFIPFASKGGMGGFNFNARILINKQIRQNTQQSSLRVYPGERADRQAKASEKERERERESVKRS